MSLRLYMDEHIPFAITAGLRAHSVDVLTVQEDRRTGEDDPVLLDRAAELDRVFFTRDADLLTEASRRQGAGEPHCGVIYTHPLRMNIGESVRELLLVAAASEPIELQNLVLFLPL